MSRAAERPTPWLALLLVVLAVGAPGSIAAQATCTFTNGSPCTLSPFNVSMTPGDVLKLTLGTISTTLGTTPSKADFLTGYIASTGPSLTVKANRAYHIAIAPATAFFCLTACPTASTKPSSNLAWATAAGGPFTSLSFGTPQTIFSGAPSTGAAPQASLFYRTGLSFAVDRAGTYALTVNITLSAP